MTEEDYICLRTRLVEDFWAYIGHKFYDLLMFMLEWIFRALGAAWPIILAWLRSKGYIDA